MRHTKSARLLVAGSTALLAVSVLAGCSSSTSSTASTAASSPAKPGSSASGPATPSAPATDVPLVSPSGSPSPTVDVFKDDDSLAIDAEITLRNGEIFAIPVSPTSEKPVPISPDVFKFSQSSLFAPAQPQKEPIDPTTVQYLPGYEGYSSVIMQAKEKGSDTITVEYKKPNGKVVTTRFKITVE